VGKLLCVRCYRRTQSRTEERESPRHRRADAAHALSVLEDVSALQLVAFEHVEHESVGDWANRFHQVGR
jgi:hypothetical protein